MVFYIAQIAGIIALSFNVFSYQKKVRKEFLFVQIFAYVFYGLQYFLLNAYSALATTIITIFKSVVFYKYEQKGRGVPMYIPLILQIIVIIIGVFTYSNIYSIIPILIFCLFTFWTWQSNLKTTYIGGIVVAIMWIFYNYSVKAYVSSFGNLFELSGSITGLIRLQKSKKEDIKEN